MAAVTQDNSQGEPSTVLAYPLPPIQYINNIDPDNLPPPPAPITEGVYFMFGQKISLDDAIIAPLEACGTKRLYPRTEYDHKKELKKINASILVNFLDLIDVLVKCPDTDKRIEKCNDIATLFINFHHLINELRPHQARETLRVWMTAQHRTREEIIKKLTAEMEKMKKVLAKYYEFEATNKISPQQQPLQQQLLQQSQQLSQQQLQLQQQIASEMESSDTKSATTNVDSRETPSLDDIMCKIVDESCS